MDDRGPYYFDAAAADLACEFFPSCLTHHKGQDWAGRPFELLPWQRELLVRPLIGWKRRSDGRRRFRKVLLFVCKKQGKTELVAGLANYFLFVDGEPGAEIVVAAADRSQATTLFDETKEMVEDDEVLRAKADIFRRSIVYRDLRSVLQVISAEARTKHGPNLQVVIVDELHAQPDRLLVETLEKGVAARREPVILYLTTAGENIESICYEEYEYAKKLIAGIITDDSYLPIVFEASPEDDWRLPATWRKAAPSLGVTVSEEYYAGEVVKAQNEPRKLATFLRLHLNIWTAQHVIWIQDETWTACTATVPTENPTGEVATLGLDLSTKYDLTACVVTLRHEDPDAAAEEEEDGEPTEGAESAPLRLNFSVSVIPYFWLPEDTLEQRCRDDRIQYDVWRDLGLLRVTPGNAVDFDVILRDILEEIVPTFHVREGGFDPWSATQMAIQLKAAGLPMFEVPQTYKHLNEPSKLLEAIVLSRRLRHDGHRVLRWCVSNTAVKQDANGNIRPVKVSRTQRADGTFALITSLARLMVQVEAPEPAFDGLWVV